MQPRRIHTHQPQAFQAQRDARPQGMVLVTPLSPSHSQWTAAAPLPVTTTRIAGLAAATLRGVERLLTTCSSSQRAGLHTPAMPGSSNKGSQSTPSGLWRALFVPALKAYDVVLVLAPGALPVAAGKPGVEQREGNPLLEDAGLLGTVRPGTVRVVVCCNTTWCWWCLLMYTHRGMQPHATRFSQPCAGV